MQSCLRCCSDTKLSSCLQSWGKTGQVAKGLPKAEGVSWRDPPLLPRNGPRTARMLHPIPHWCNEDLPESLALKNGALPEWSTVTLMPIRPVAGEQRCRSEEVADASPPDSNHS